MPRMSRVKNWLGSSGVHHRHIRKHPMPERNAHTYRRPPRAQAPAVQRRERQGDAAVRRGLPGKASYFERTDKNEQWILPAPGILEGIKSRGRTIFKTQHVDFKYPTHEENTVEVIKQSASTPASWSSVPTALESLLPLS